MSTASSPAGPRRSQRDRKPAKPITTVTNVATISRKRKHADTDNEEPTDVDESLERDDEEDGDAEDGVENDADGEEDEDEEADDRRKRQKRKAKAPTAKKARTVPSATRKPRKPRVPKDPTAATSYKRAAGASKSKQSGNAPFDPASAERLTNISSDNPLFNALINPNSALQGTAEDFLESLDQNANEALAELINMILRSCGCNETISGDTAVDYDGVADRLDDIVEELKNTTSPAGSYPLISKAPSFYNAKMKYSFRSNLSEFITRLITSAALLDSLYNSPLVETLEVWLVPMSSSQIRSIRHTATVIALEVEAALCQVGKDVEKEAEVAGRMREGEKKRARTKGGAEQGASGTKGKEKELETRLRDIKEKQNKLEEFIKEFVDGVFIHRYRDLDPVIRTECISSLATFFATLPSHFCANTTYLRYVGWVLSDAAVGVRLAALKALQVVYEGMGPGGGGKKKKGGANGGGVVLPALTHFTTRSLPRLLEIARYDVDVGVRVASMVVLGYVDDLGLLSETDRNRLGTMIYSNEVRVRKGVGRFVSGVWQEWVDSRKGEIEVHASSSSTRGRGRGRGRGGAAASKDRSRVDEDIDEEKIGIKGLVHLLVKWGRALDREQRKQLMRQEGDADEEEEEEEEEGAARDDTAVSSQTSSGGYENGGIAAALASPPGKKVGDAATRGRTTLAVEAVWDDLEVVRNWEGILDMLVLDHSASGESSSSRDRGRGRTGVSKKRMKPNGKGKTREATHEDDSGDDDDDASTTTKVDESWRLNEGEEGVLLEVLIASLRRTRKDDESTAESITQALIKALPRLFIKYQTDENKITDVLALPTLMNLEVYLEMRETNAYASLWSDISKQFLTHTSPYVLTTAVHTITSHLITNTALSNTNSEQILELEDELATSLRDAIASPAPPPASDGDGESSSRGKEDRDIEVVHLTEDEILTLTSVVLRLRILAGSRDMTAWMEESEGGKQSSVWDILCAIAERGRLSVGGEGDMIEQTLQLLALHVIWKSRSLAVSSTSSPEEVKQQELLITQRDFLIEKLVEYAVGTQVQGNGVVENVKRAAFKNLLDLHVLFSSSETVAADGSPLLLASEKMALSMDDEIQWRCAGYVQAEVQRYAETLELGDEEDDVVQDTEGESEDENDENDENNENNAKATKKSSKTGSKEENGVEADKHMTSNTRTQLEQEYIFIDVISTFLRAIRAGAIQIRHGAILLAHYGRLGAAFDACAKVIVEALREEGMVNDHGDIVVLVVTQAMKEAFGLVKDSRMLDEPGVVALGKLLSSSFVIRGSQLSVIRRLDIEYVVEIQTNLLSWVAKQLGSHQKSSNKKGVKTTLLFFRALIPLIGAMQSRDALKIKAHLDQVLAQETVEPNASKVWEPLRAYEKRLGTAMGKDKPARPKGRSKKKKNAGATSTDEGEESEIGKALDHEEEGTELSDAPDPVVPPARPQRPRRAAARAPVEAQNGLDSEPEPDPTTPKARPRPKPTYKSKKNVSPTKPATPVDGASHPLENGFITPSQSRKRAREETDDEDDGVSASRKRAREATEPQEADTQGISQQSQQAAADDGGSELSEPPLSEPPQSRQGTPVADVQIKRKRIRH